MIQKSIILKLKITAKMYNLKDLKQAKKFWDTEFSEDPKRALSKVDFRFRGLQSSDQGFTSV